MKSISKPTFVAMSQTRIKSPSSVQHWLLSLSLHIMLFFVVVFLTSHFKNQEIPTRIVETAFVVFTEQDNLKKKLSANTTQGREGIEKYDKANERIVPTNQPDVGDVANQVKPGKIKDNSPPNAQSQKVTTKESKKFMGPSTKEPNLSPAVSDPLQAAKKDDEPNAERVLVNEDYTEFLIRIERKKVKFDPKSLAVQSGFSSELQELPQVNSRKNSSIPNIKSSATSCSGKASQRQAPLLDKAFRSHYHQPDSRQAVRISDLVGHGRYAQPSMSVRVSDLLNVGSQLKQIGRSSESVTVSDLLQQHGSGFQSFCK